MGDERPVGQGRRMERRHGSYSSSIKSTSTAQQAHSTAHHRRRVEKPARGNIPFVNRGLGSSGFVLGLCVGVVALERGHLVVVAFVVGGALARLAGHGAQVGHVAACEFGEVDAAKVTCRGGGGGMAVGFSGFGRAFFYKI
ncbi:hypothetical protein CDD80_5623 [Ophiocordyceps camponoti-rufipedis]|uniref:Uncharacterized protein n=1 Tax=Ophiocordyceps camponoti-rufipedis TaxID=2004952 RepID=A0A2C5YVA9_9HYPO|nr:hypothetical protein CDD80_5623 [Ophiocordyceps camponoti-rufipedis]